MNVEDFLKHEISRRQFLGSSAKNAAGVAAGMVGLGHYVSPLDLTPKQGAACVFAIYAFAITLAVWQWVGIWRSASRHHERGGKRNWAYLAKASVILGAVLTVAELSRTGAPLLIDSFNTITGQTDIPEVQFHIGQAW